MTKPRMLAALIFAALAVTALVQMQRSDESPGVSAQVVVQNACDTMAEQTAFDMKTVITMPTLGGWDGSDTLVTVTSEADSEDLDTRAGTDEAILNARVSGRNYHMTSTLNGQPWGESMGFDGHLYGRWAGEEWEAHRPEFSISFLEQMVGTHQVEGTNVICPDLGSVARVGEEMLDGASVDHFRLTDFEDDVGSVGNVDAPSDNDMYADPWERTWDFWVNTDGQLLQTRQVFVRPHEDADFPDVRMELVTRISGVGDPNIITEPNVGSP